LDAKVKALILDEEGEGYGYVEVLQMNKIVYLQIPVSWGNVNPRGGGGDVKAIVNESGQGIYRHKSQKQEFFLGKEAVDTVETPLYVSWNSEAEGGGDWGGYEAG